VAVHETAVRVIDTDDEFRERVAAEADDAIVGRAGLLWLTRPEGWRDELDELVGTEDEPAARARARRRSDRQREERRAAQQEVADARRAAAVAEEGRRAALARADALQVELAAAQARLAELAADRTDAVRRLKEAEERASAAAAERNELRRSLREHTTATDRAEPARAPDDAPRVDTARAAAAADRAAATAAELAASLGDLARDLEPPPAASRNPDHHGLPVRRPVALPGGVEDSSAEAAEHLVKVRGAVLVVDGYNVSHAAWGDLPIDEQRRRLLDALDELSARTGIDVDVVFDGPDEALPGTSGGRRGVRVRFSGPGTTADDVVVELCGAYPPQRAVVAASSDNEVREGARAHGANLLHATQLLAALNRA
jgi:predicted RNA-binding protein with PIN domain